MTFYTGTRYPGWTGSLFVCGLASQQLRRIELSGDQVRHQEVVLDQVGRVRDVAVGPDGYLYLALQSPGQRLSDSTPGSVVRLIPL
jgi:glucose/arabinose dehydrogenase